MIGSAYYRVRVPQIAHETIDGEVVIINLDTGSYYSLSGAGAVAWGALAGGGTVDDVTTAVANHYSGDAAAIRASLATLVETLQAEGVLVADGAASTAAGSPAAATPASGDRPAFLAPTLQKYTDMQDLLLLDPIHEVADTGWPHKG